MAQQSPISWKERLLYSRVDPRSQERKHLLGVVNNVILHLHPATVPAQVLRITYTWGLGGISAVLALLLGMTGLLLMFRYDAACRLRLYQHPTARNPGDFWLAGARHAPLVCQPAGDYFFFALIESIFDRRL